MKKKVTAIFLAIIACFVFIFGMSSLSKYVVKKPVGSLQLHIKPSSNEPFTLMPGWQFNQTIIGNPLRGAENEAAENDTTEKAPEGINPGVKNLIFDYYTDYEEIIKGVEGVNVAMTVNSQQIVDGIKAYSVGDTVYVLSNQKIHAYSGTNSKLLMEEGGDYIEEHVPSFINESTPYYTNYFSLMFFCESILFNNFDTTNVTDFRGLFSLSPRLTNLDLSSFNTSKVEDMSYMFTGVGAAFRVFIDQTEFESWFDPNEWQPAKININGWDTSKVKNMEYMFALCLVDSADLFLELETDSVTNMRCMFYDASVLKEWEIDLDDFYLNCVYGGEIDVSHFNTTNVTNMEGMFSTMVTAEIVGLDHLDTSNVTSMEGMFYDTQFSVIDKFGNSHLKDNALYINIDTKNVTNMSYMFKELSIADYSRSDVIDSTLKFCNPNTNISKFDTSKVESMKYMFSQLSLDVLDLSTAKFNTSNVKDMSYMFSFTSSLDMIILGDLFTTKNTVDLHNMFLHNDFTTFGDEKTVFDLSSAENASSMFGDCRYLTSVGVKRQNATNNLNIDNMFKGCSNLSEIDIEYFDATGIKSMTYLFAGCLNITRLNFKSFNSSSAQDMSNMFAGCVKLKNLINLSQLKTSNVENMSEMFSSCSSLTTLDLVSFDTLKVTNMFRMFGNCSQLETINLSSFNTSNVTNMGSMFENCYQLKTINLSSFNTSNVTNMGSMFYNCKSLTELDLTSFNTSNVTYMSHMFGNYGDDNDPNEKKSSLKNIIFGDGWDTSKVTSMNSMFSRCVSLETIDLTRFDTSACTKMYNMFYGCSGLKTIDLTKFNTSACTTMQKMFVNCKTLTELDLSSFDTSKVKDMQNMFEDCSKLTTIYVSEGWSVENLGETGSSKSKGLKMFSGCSSLIGEQGTIYDRNNPIDHTYAHVDGGTANPGYFTYKPAPTH